MYYYMFFIIIKNVMASISHDEFQKNITFKMLSDEL